MSYIIPIEEDDDGELLITFPDELMEKMNWQVGDTIEWIDNENGSWTLKKK